MCGAPPQTPTLPPGIDLTKETVIYGIVTDSDGTPVTSATGDFRFFAAPGKWTLSVLHRAGSARKDVHALEPGLVEAPLQVQ
jgi:hypothetical protein